jgi:hypothetical protein
MSKRTKKDINNTTVEAGSTAADLSLGAAAAASSSAAGTTKKRASRKNSKTAVLEPGVSAQDEVELEQLLQQVDSMLTEMTQSKWLSSDWPTLEIEFGNKKK